MERKAIVVGCGIAGIASAIRLANKGFIVTVYEANSSFGGKIGTLLNGDYRFDTGPSLFTMPHYVEELFELSGKKTSDYFEYVENDVACKYFFDDGTQLNFYSDLQKLSQEVEDKLKISSKNIKKHFQKSKFIYESTSGVFLERSLHKIKTYVTKAFFKALINSSRLHLLSSMHSVNRRKLNHPKLIQIFDRFATYNGSSPYLAPGILNVIPHLEHGFGTFFPKKGMHAIPESLVKLAKELGVSFEFNKKVDEILYDKNKCRGIRIGEEVFSAEIVICNSDIKFVYKGLLPKLETPKKVLKQEPSSSALIFYWGMNTSFPALDLHNIFFSSDYKKEFDDIFKEKKVFQDPTIYVHVSSRVVENDSPDNCESWFVMVNVPHNSGQNWDEIRVQVKSQVLKKLSNILGEDIESKIVCEEYLDPVRIEKRTSSFAGALYGASSNDRMAAFFRHSNFSKIKGLYFVGGSVHPGGGIPLCLLSAKIACADIK